MLPLVRLENGDEYLVEVGYGNSKVLRLCSRYSAPNRKVNSLIVSSNQGTCIPIRVEHDKATEGPNGWHKVLKEEDSKEWTVWYRKLDSDESHWEKLYSFEVIHREIEEFVPCCKMFERDEFEPCHLMSTNPIVMLRVWTRKATGTAFNIKEYTSEFS